MGVFAPTLIIIMPGLNACGFQNKLSLITPLTGFTLLIRAEKIIYFSHRARIIIILFLEIVIPRIIRDANY